MRVLMFGWEFPPHISGGLGTACQGLASSLSLEENINILFVVPKLNGGESAEQTTFLNGSTVPISKASDPGEYISYTSVDPETREALLQAIKREAGIQKVEVSSGLSPYRSLSFNPGASAIEHWNYSLAREEKKFIASTQEQPAPGEGTYKFSGSYGPGLMEEVRRYAQVGASIARQNSFDVIHAHDWMTYLAGIAAKKVSGKPLVVHVHATEFDRSGEHVDPQVHAIEKHGMTEADCVVTVSEWTKKVTVNKYHIDEKKVRVVHNGIIPRASAEKHFTTPPLGAHVVTFLGRITHQKGPMYFVEAARQVLQHIPDAHFVVAGAGDQLPMMIERIAQLRMSSRFHFTGFLRGKDVDKIWSMSNVYVMPSVSEPFGIAPLEAIQAGVPVIISNQSGVAEVMPHAIKVDFWNTHALASAICSVLRYRSLSSALSHNGVEEIGEISWNAAAKKISQLYHGLTAEQRYV